MDKSYPPVICWLKVTDYMQGWLQDELGGNARVKDQRVVCVQHLKGAREIFRMETDDRPPGKGIPGNSISAAWRNALDAGLAIDADAIQREYGMTKEMLRLYVPVECPKMAMTRNGVLRPWSLDVCFGAKQSMALQRLLREAFWRAVSEYSRQYAHEHRGRRYAQADMIESFCVQTGTPDIHVEAMRREWQRRVKREKNSPRTAPCG